MHTLCHWQLVSGTTYFSRERNSYIELTLFRLLPVTERMLEHPGISTSIERFCPGRRRTRAGGDPESGRSRHQLASILVPAR